eukprot:1523915-Rhodomonas_salina.4
MVVLSSNVVPTSTVVLDPPGSPHPHFNENAELHTSAHTQHSSYVHSPAPQALDLSVCALLLPTPLHLPLLLALQSRWHRTTLALSCHFETPAQVSSPQACARAVSWTQTTHNHWERAAHNIQRRVN